MLFEAEFWVLVSFVIFMGILAYVGVPKMVGRSLDDRSARVRAELDEARRLRDEAAALLAEFRGKQHEAEREAELILRNATLEAERMAAETAGKIEEYIARRTKIAEAKIGQAEAQALAEVRAVAADTAVAAAEKVLSQSAKGKAGEQLIVQGIKDVQAKLN